MSLSKNQVNNMCLIGSGNTTCRYLAVDDADYSKFHCLKHKLDIKKKIDVLVNDSLNKSTNKGSVPLGDNCAGYPILKNIEQGYDI